MHQEARAWVEVHATNAPRVLDIGGRNVNGSLRDLFPDITEYVAIDLYDGEGVDVVGDVTSWHPMRVFDLVLCCEVFEHTDKWRDIINAAYELTATGGTFICTAAGPGREPHSAHDGGPVRDGEFYENIGWQDLVAALTEAGFRVREANELGTDVRAIAIK